jgi:hypothetical protein
METKLDFDNWTRYHALLLPKLPVGIEKTGKRIRVGKAETVEWINCERSEFMLVNSLSPKVEKLVTNYGTVRQKWKKLYSHFSGKNKGKAQSAIKSLTSVSRATDTLTDFIANVEEAVTKCEIAHGKDSIKFEDLGKTMLLAGLDMAFNPIRTVLENNDESLTFRQLAQRLLNDEQNRTDNEAVAEL